MEAQQNVAQARVDVKTRVQEAEATVAVKLCTGERRSLPRILHCSPYANSMHVNALFCKYSSRLELKERAMEQPSKLNVQVQSRKVQIHFQPVDNTCAGLEDL
jgi:hypothetical protein